jgi:diguanylate cyclase (GGDEF)-like protein
MVLSDRTEAALVDDDERVAALLLGAVRTLLRVRTVEEVVGVLIGVVGAFGGRTVPAHADDPDAIPVDLSFGEGDPLLASAPMGSRARAHLESVLPRLVEDARVMVRRVRTADQLSSESIIEPLTGLLNRRGVDRAASRLRAGDTVVAIDLDRFKSTNDTFGHDAGDAVLRAFSRSLRGQLRVFDVAGRPGGDEFIVIMPRTSPSDAAAAMGRVRDVWTADRKYDVGFSAGIALVQSDGSTTALRDADHALYDAKRAGRDRTSIAAGEQVPE